MISTHLLPLPYSYQGTDSVLYPVFIETPQANILVDCGYPGMMDLLTEALQEAGFDWHRVDALFITHHDIDHYGSAAAIKAAHPNVQVWAPEEEVPFIEGRRKSLRLQQAEDMFAQLPPEHHTWALAFQESLRTVEPVKVDRSFAFGASAYLVPGLRLLHTPGHMPGHASLFAEEESVLITADAVVLENGRLAIANPDFCLHLPAAFDSVKKLASLQSQMLICYHGGLQQDQLEILWAQLLNQAPA